MKHAGVTFRPIGVLRTPHTQPELTPIRPVYALDCLRAFCGRPDQRPRRG